MILCELEDTLYDCFEPTKDDEEHDETEEGTDLGFKGSRRYSMRNFVDDDMKHGYRSRMRMRRNRMGRYN